MTREKAAELEESTREQSNSSQWYEERRIRITSSVFGRVCRRLPTTLPGPLVNSIVNQRMYQSMPLSCAWGKDNEKKALNAYKQTMHDKGHTNLVVMMSGLIINPEYAYLGASPDGIVSDPTSTNPNGLLEIKCPYQARNSTPFEAATQKGFFCNINNGTLVLKKTHHYYYQVQGQMAISSRKWCDFVVYTTAGISIERIEFDELFWNDTVTKLKHFYDTYIVSKLIEKVHN